MARPKDSKYDSFARHRIWHRVLELHAQFGSWEALARDISDQFDRTYFSRMHKGTAGDGIYYTVQAWLTRRDPGFPATLTPDSIFADMGASARDYYFHLFTMANLDEWDEGLLQEYEGVYLCAPEADAHSYLPSPYVRDCLEKKINLPEAWRSKRSTDIRQYISERSFLILKRTQAHYFHAAEVPYGALFPASFQTLDVNMFHEGIGIASSNTIHVFLRDCLSRVPKIHSIVIRPKAGFQIAERAGLKLYADPAIRYLPDERAAMDEAMSRHLRAEFALDAASDVFLRGSSQVNVSPVPLARNAVDTVFGTEQVYHRKPRGFLSDPKVHFIRPDLDIRPELSKLLDNPLLVGELA